MQEFDEKELLAIIKTGSIEAYEALFHKYYKPLCLQAMILLKGEAEAEDLVQGLFIELWDKKRYRQIDSSVKSYLFKAVKNRCINKLKKDKIIQKKLEEYQIYRQKKNIPMWREGAELSTRITNTIKEFPSQRQRAFTLVYLEDKKYKEAADEMGISINSVKTHLKLALQTLRDKL